MKGTVRTENKCPRCGENFQETLRSLKCVKCKTTPNKSYIDFWWKGERIRVFLDKDGNPLTSYEAANRFLNRMRTAVDDGLFNPKDYIRVEVRGLQFSNYVTAWVERRRQEIEQELKVIQAVLGHSSIASTQRYAYLHPSTLLTFWDTKEYRQQTVSKTQQADVNIL